MAQIEKLKEACSTSPIINALFVHWNEYGRNVSEHRARRLFAQTAELGNYSELIAALRVLQELGCGEFIVSRHSVPTRFVWEEGAMLPTVREVLGSSLATSVATPVSKIIGKTVARTFLLTRDGKEMPIDFQIPTDLSEREASRLSSFIMSCAQ
jgi:hypothetical protein